MRRMPIAAAAIVMYLAVGAAPVTAQGTTADPSPATIGQPADDGARIVLVETLDARTRDLTIESPAVGTVQVRLLLPASFEEGAGTLFSVLYLLHGGGGDYTDWTKNTDVEAITASTDLLVAMPAAASSNLGTWLPGGGPDGTGGPPNWERFHLAELRQLLERNWHAGEERAIGGLSLGGYGAVQYAGRNPRLFIAVASYSGVLDLTVTTGDSTVVQAVIDQALQLAEAAGWDEANPINLVPALEETALYISYGNGEPGPLDPEGTEQDALEEWVGKGGDNFVAALVEADVSAAVNAYGPGTHSWSYWDRELQAALPILLEALGETAASPSASSTS